MSARSPRPPRRAVVIGVGNTLMADDGVGVTAVRRLLTGDDAAAVAAVGPVSAGTGRHFPDALGRGVDVVLGETAGLALVKHLRDVALVIAVDALDASAQGAVPGEIFRLGPDQLNDMALRSTNIHGMGLPHLVAAARLTGADPEIVVFAVQVGDVRPVPDTLTPKVDKAARRVGELICDELARRGIARRAGTDS